jgi:hypothetical protein
MCASCQLGGAHRRGPPDFRSAQPQCTGRGPEWWSSVADAGLPRPQLRGGPMRLKTDESRAGIATGAGGVGAPVLLVMPYCPAMVSSNDGPVAPLLHDFSECWRVEHLDRLMTLFHPEAIRFGRWGMIQRGLEEIRARYRHVFDATEGTQVSFVTHSLAPAEGERLRWEGLLRVDFPAGRRVEKLMTMFLDDGAPRRISELRMGTAPPPGHQASLDKVFCIGLAQTGTQSVTDFLRKLGVLLADNPLDETTYEELTCGRYALSLLRVWDGLGDHTAAPFHAQLEQAHPTARFILTVRERGPWLSAMERALADPLRWGAQHRMTRFLRSVAYGTHAFEPTRLSYAYQRHLEDARRWFADRPHKLLVLDVTAPDAAERLAKFVGRPLPDQPFPFTADDPLEGPRPD